VIEAMVQLEKVCESSTIDDLAALSDDVAKGSREFEEAYRNQLKKFFDEKLLPPPFGKRERKKKRKKRKLRERKKLFLLLFSSFFFWVLYVQNTIPLPLLSLPRSESGLTLSTVCSFRLSISSLEVLSEGGTKLRLTSTSTPSSLPEPQRSSLKRQPRSRIF
jgi:hypothetical protein